jgi:hypothetical protein
MNKLQMLLHLLKIAIGGASIVSAFQSNHPGSPSTRLSASPNHSTPPTLASLPRRSLLATALLPAILSLPSRADDFESIADRAAALAKLQENDASAEDERNAELSKKLKEDTRTIYDFELPVGGVMRPLADLVGEAKAVLVVNIKQDDPLARKNIPELIALAERCGKGRELELRILLHFDFETWKLTPCMIVYYLGLVKMETLRSLFLPRIRGRCITRVIFSNEACPERNGPSR